MFVRPGEAWSSSRWAGSPRDGHGTTRSRPGWFIVVSDPYESALRDGVMVTTRSATVMQDGGLVGKALVTYRTDQGEEQVSGTVTGTRGSM